MRVIAYSCILLGLAFGQDSLNMMEAMSLPPTQPIDTTKVDTSAQLVQDIIMMSEAPTQGHSLAILPQLQGDRIFKTLSIDSLLRNEIATNQLTDLYTLPDPASSYAENELCLDDSCLSQFAKTAPIDRLMVWKIVDDHQLVISLIGLISPYEIKTSEVALDKPQKHQDRIELDIRKAVWDLTETTPPPGYFEEIQEKAWYYWFTEEPNRYYAGGAGAAFIIWLIYQLLDTEADDGIGLPPDWPEN